MAGVTKDSLLSRLQELGIPVRLFEHPVVMRVEEQVSFIGHLEGDVAKNLFLKDKKGRLYLVSALSTTNVDLKVLSQRLGLGKGGLRMAPEDALQEVLKVPLGSVTPLALINTSARSVILLLDHKLRNSPRIFVHPLVNDSSLAISASELDIFLKSIYREPAYVDLEANVAVGKDQPPDLAKYVTVACEKPVETNEPAPAPVNKDANVKVSTNKPAPTSKADQSGTVRKLVEDPEQLLNHILEQTIRMTMEKVKTEVGDDRMNGDLVSSISDEVVKQVSPDLERIIVLFKNTAYTAGLFAGKSR